MPTEPEFATSWREVVRSVLLIGSAVIATGAALAPVVYLLRRIGVG